MQSETFIIIMYFMELGHLLTRSGLTYPEVSSKVYQDSFCQLGSSVSLPWVIYFEASYLHVVSSFSCIPVICPKLVLFSTHLQSVHLFCNLPKCILLFFSCISSWEFLGIKGRSWIPFQRRKGVAAERTSRGWHISKCSGSWRRNRNPVLLFWMYICSPFHWDFYFLTTAICEIE